MERKIDVLRAAMVAGDWRCALKVAARFPRLGEHKVAIERGWAAIVNPGMYRQMGRDPDTMVADGIAALKARYPS